MPIKINTGDLTKTTKLKSTSHIMYMLETVMLPNVRNTNRVYIQLLRTKSIHAWPYSYRNDIRGYVRFPLLRAMVEDGPLVSSALN